MSPHASRLIVAVSLLALLGACGGATAAKPARTGTDWTRFGYDAARTGVGPASTGITASNVGRLRRQRIGLDGTVDSSAIYLHGVRVGGANRDVFFVTTTYGKTIALDADTGKVLWRFVPSGYASWAGTYRITTATPVADPGRAAIYTASPDGRIHKLAVASGREARGWPVAITRDPTHEKIASPLNFSRGLVVATIGGYIGDAPPYQGHVAVISPAGRLLHIWNALCSNRRGVLTPSTCTGTRAAIWARAGAVVDPATGNLLVATGNGPFDGKTLWGDSVLLLSPDASRLLGNWTPRDQASLDQSDLDVGSTAPALLGNGLAVQGGKDRKLRLLRVARLNGSARAGQRVGGELQTLSTPGGTEIFTAPAVWRSGGKTWLFVADGTATGAYVVQGARLRLAWQAAHRGTSPVVAGGLLYVYDPAGALRVYRPGTGKLLATLPAGPGHWNSPIVADGRIALPEGDANAHQQTGVLDVYRT